MPDLINTALSGLLAYQRSLAVVSHNIANASTPGYSRQRAELQAIEPHTIGGIGNGVRATDVRRIYDEFLTGQMREANAQAQQLETFHAQASLLDDVLADPQGGITPALQAFFAAVQDVADDPGSSPARITLLDQADALAARFHVLEDRMADQAAHANAVIAGSISDINDLARAIGQVNVEVLSARDSTSLPPPDLLDRRDRLLQELSDLVAVSVVENTDGTINVFVGNGQTLVTNATVFSLGTSRDPADLSRLRVTYTDPAGTVDVTPQLTGGRLGGTLEYRETLLEQMRNSLGRVALALGETFNAQHRDGMDLNGNLGGAFFSVTGPQVLPNAGNAGAATVTAAIVDVGALTKQNYDLRFDGANFTLSAADGSASVAGAGPTLTLDGFSVTVAGAAAAGDRFLIRPARLGAQSLDVALSDPAGVAAAVPVTTAAALGNASSASISSGQVLDVNDPNLLDNVLIRFNSAADFDILDAGNGAVLAAAVPYTSGADIDFNGWRVQINGQPQAGDEFSISSNAGGVADNRNMLLLGALQTTPVLDNGNANYQEAYATLVSEVGAATREARVSADAQQVLFASAETRRESLSGVNLDEEAANLVRFQQAYQAMARALAAADDVFQTLLNAV